MQSWGDEGCSHVSVRYVLHFIWTTPIIPTTTTNTLSPASGLWDRTKEALEVNEAVIL